MRRLKELGDAPVVTCVIVQGELMFMAHKSEYRHANEARIRAFLRGIAVYPVDQAAADLYGKIKAAIIEHFGPSRKAQRKKTEVQAIGFQENDLWIAAIAKRHGFVVVSADTDFSRVAQVEDLLIEKWWSPRTE